MVGKLFKTLFNWACEHLEIDYAIYPVDRSNIPSRKIPESLGGRIFKKTIVNTISAAIPELLTTMHLYGFKFFQNSEANKPLCTSSTPINTMSPENLSYIAFL